jgi:putative hemolysin
VSTGDFLVLMVVVVLFFCSIVLALSEMAFARMSRIRALALEDEGRKGAARLARMLEHPEQTINSVLLLLLVSQLTSASLIGIQLEKHLGPYGVLVGLVVQIVLFFAIGEVAPKTYAIQHTERAALMVTPFLYAVTNFPPLRALSRSLIGLANVLLPGRGLKEGPFVTEEDLRTMADVAANEDAIENEERRLIHSIFEFGDTVVREVMTPRPDMVAIEMDAMVEEAIEQAISKGFSRLPVYEDTTDNIVGLVYLKDLVRRARAGRGSETLRRSIRAAVFVPEQKRVAELLHEMQERQFHMAIVVDEHGGTAGLVTLEDLLEEIVGEITDEYDVEEPHVEHLSDGDLVVAGRVSMSALSEELGVELPDEEWDTVGGLVFNLLGHVPVEGETVRLQGLEFRTEQVQGRRIAKVRIHRVEDDDKGKGKHRGKDKDTLSDAAPAADIAPPT